MCRGSVCEMRKSKGNGPSGNERRETDKELWEVVTRIYVTEDLSKHINGESHRVWFSPVQFGPSRVVCPNTVTDVNGVT